MTYDNPGKKRVGAKRGGGEKKIENRQRSLLVASRRVKRVRLMPDDPARGGVDVRGGWRSGGRTRWRSRSGGGRGVGGCGGNNRKKAPLANPPPPSNARSFYFLSPTDGSTPEEPMRTFLTVPPSSPQYHSALGFLSQIRRPCPPSRACASLPSSPGEKA